MVFWTDRPEPGLGPGLCAMIAVNNILQTELFTACSFSRQIRTDAFEKRFLAKYPDVGSRGRLLRMRREPRTAGVTGHETEHVLYLTGHKVKVVPWYYTYNRAGGKVADPASYVTRPMPTLAYLLNRAHAMGAIAIQLSIAQPVFNVPTWAGGGWQRLPDRRLSTRGVQRITRMHVVVLRRVDGVWYILDGNHEPWFHGPVPGDAVIPGGILEKNWAVLRGPEDDHKFQHFFRVTGLTLCTFVRFVSKSTNPIQDRPHEKVVRSFIQKRQNVKAVRRDARHTNGKNQGIKACGGRNVPWSSYTYIPAPPQQNCKDIQLKYGPGCKTYRKCISAATIKKTGL